MNSNPRQKLFTGTTVLFLLVCFIPAIAGAFTPDDCNRGKRFGMKRHHGSPLGIWRNPKMVQELRLTEQQVKKLRDADFANREKRLDVKSQLNGLHLQLEKLFSHDSVNAPDVLNVAQKISDLKGTLFVQKIESRLALEKLLTADQLKQLKTYRWNRHAGSGQCNEKHYGPGTLGKFQVTDPNKL